ncbi:hypothetical protein QUF58_09275 [Anaerolineales bacterium HSG24]|nr:hypothetical protein [Anaerolineales bacterium HSG24]
MLKNDKSLSLYALLGYLLVALIATWPLVTHLDGYVPGIGDWGQNMWALWWTRHSLLTLGQSPFYTHHLFYPEGITLLFHPLDVADGLLSIPLYGLLGSDISYNLMVLLSFVLSGYGLYLLAFYLTGHRLASWVAGLVFTLAPYHFLRLDIGHLNLSTMQWIPFYVLFCLKTIQSHQRHKRGQYGLLTIFFLTSMALHSWYYVIYCGLFTIALIFYPTPYPTLTELRHRLPTIILIPSLTILLLSPLIMPMFQLLDSTTLIGEHNPLRHSVDLLSFWIPGPPSTWANWFESSWLPYAAQHREPGASAYLGYTVLVVSLIGLLGKLYRRLAVWWAVVALVFTSLALGPQLQLNGQVLDIPMPYQFLSNLIPAFSITGIPGRFIIMTSLCLSVLTAYGLSTIQTNLTRRVSCILHPASSIFLIALFIMLEYSAVPLPLSSTALPDIYHQLATEPESYSILDIRWDANYLLHAQTIHLKPLIGGWLARLPAEQAAYLDEPSLDKIFLHLLLGPDGPTMTDPQAIQTALDQRQVRYIIDHNGTATPFLEPLLDWPIIYQNERMIVYENLP